MTLQNRVTPFGEIVAIPQRGLFTGNRGIIHDPSTRTLLRRRWAGRAWIICSCSYKGMRRRVMGGRSWTELFFLDEAVALAAGHRPCFLCRHQAAEAFRAAWGRAWHPDADPPRAPEIDRVLHRQRLEGRGKRRHPLPGPVVGLPDGTMIATGEDAFLVLGGRCRRWTAAGYGPDVPPPDRAELLTPPASLGALRAGYRPVLHPGLAPP